MTSWLAHDRPDLENIKQTILPKKRLTAGCFERTKYECWNTLLRVRGDRGSVLRRPTTWPHQGGSREYIYYCERPSSLVFLAKSLLFLEIHLRLSTYIAHALSERAKVSRFDFLFVKQVALTILCPCVGWAVHSFVEWLLP